MARTYLGYASNLRNAPLDVTALPIAATTADRDAGFPSPAEGQRVQNLETGNIERWDGAAWVTDFYGAGVPFAVAAAYVEPGTFGSAVGAGVDDLYAVPGDFAVGRDLDVVRDVVAGRDIGVVRDASVGGNLAVTGYVQTPRLTGVAAALALGLAVAGTNVAATSFNLDAPLSSGNATPAALIVRVGVQGASGATPQTATEAFRVQEVANNTGREIALSLSQTNSILSVGLPSNTLPQLLAAGLSSRFSGVTQTIRQAGVAQHIVSRVNGTFAAPSYPTTGQSLAGFRYAQSDQSTGAFRFPAGVLFTARENFSATTMGTQTEITACDIGTNAEKAIIILRGAGTGIGEMLSGNSTLRIIPGATQFAIRDSGNTADTFTINAAGTLLTAPVLTAAVWGVDPGGADFFRIGGSLRINAATMISTATSFMNGAGAASGTLTNAPSAGNPTKWIPVNDNGTTRYLPAW